MDRSLSETGQRLNRLEHRLERIWHRKWTARISFLKIQVEMQRSLSEEGNVDRMQWNDKLSECHSQIAEIKRQEETILNEIRYFDLQPPPISDELIKVVGFKILKIRLFPLLDLEQDILSFFNDVKLAEDKVRKIQGRLEATFRTGNLQSFLERLEIMWWRFDGESVRAIEDQLTKDNEQILQALEMMGSFVEGRIRL